MVDYFKIRIMALTFQPVRIIRLLGQPNIRNTKFGRAYDFKLLSPLYPTNVHWLRVTLTPTGKLEISGSIRKWWLGNKSLNDLTFLEFEMALKAIAEKLKISLTALLSAKLKSVELGYCIWLRLPDFPFHHLALNFPRMERIEHQFSVAFVEKSQRLKIKLYNKTSELIERGGFVDLATLKKNTTVYRFEIAIGKVRMIKDRYGDIEVIGDILKRWNFLNLKWFAEFNKIEFGKIAILNDDELSNLSISEHKKYSLTVRPLEKVLSEISLLKAKASNKSRYRKELLSYHTTFTSGNSKKIIALFKEKVRQKAVGGLINKEQICKN